MNEAVTAPPIIAAAVSRVSLAIQVDNYSLEAQKKRIRDLNEKWGPFEIPDEYLLDDGGYSGRSFDRPAFKQALRLAQQRKIGAIVFPFVDRFSRSVEPGLAMIRQLRETGVKVILGELGPVSDESHAKLLLYTLLGVAEMQRDSIVEKSKGGVAVKVKNGLAHGGHSPYGWRFQSALDIAAEALSKGLPVPQGKPQNRHRRVEKDIETIRLMGQLALEGMSLRGIAREMGARGIASPNGKRRWNSTHVNNVLCNELYSTGVWCYGKRVYSTPKAKRRWTAEATKSGKLTPRTDWIPQPLEGGPIWTPDEHRAILEAVERNRTAFLGRRKGANGVEALLKSLVTCKLCGKSVVSLHKMYKARRYLWYRCGNREPLTAGRRCPALSVRGEVIETAIWEAFQRAISTELRDRVREHFDALREKSAGDADLEALKAQRTRLDGKRREAMIDKIDADDPRDKELYASKVRELAAQIAVLDQRIAAADAASAFEAVDFESITQRIEAGARTTNPKFRRELLLKTVEEIVWEGEEAEMMLRIPLVANCKLHQLPLAAEKRGSSAEVAAHRAAY
jgi:site-specific DNA recombinase